MQHHTPQKPSLKLVQSIPTPTRISLNTPPPDSNQTDGEEAAQSARDGKIVLDRVYEHVTLPQIVFDVIDTPEFQRLRGLKQLGFTSWLYPGATHTRFEHSIGVAHLANLMVKKIARRQPELEVNEADVLVVTVAGLCHDIGHGPFSHLFEVIVNKVREERGLPEFHHESMSVTLLRRILGRMNLANYGLDQRDANLIALCIKGLKPGDPWPEEETGRDERKRFLVEIVSNKRNGIDVDKLDYFMRDSLCCFGRASVDCHILRLIGACRVLKYNNEHQLCFEEKLAQSLGDIFALRAKMHKYAYQHRIIRVIDHMVTDILSLADPFLKVRGSNGSCLRVSQCVEDEEGYIRLGDWIMSAIDGSPDPEMGPAQALLARLNNRDFYAVVGHGTLADYTDSSVNKKEVHKALLAILTRKIKENGGSLVGLLEADVEPTVTAAAQKGMINLGFTPSNSAAASELNSPAGPPNPTRATVAGEGLNRHRSPKLASNRPVPLTRSNTEAPPVEEDPHGMSAEAHAFLKEAENTVIVDFVKITYGSSDSEGNPDDPINHVTFFNPKKSLSAGFSLPADRQSALFSPTKFGEKSILLIVRNQKFGPIFASAFEEWKNINRRRFVAAVPVYNFSPSKNSGLKRPRDVDYYSENSNGFN